MAILKPKLTKDGRADALKKELEPNYRPRRKLNLWLDGEILYRFKMRAVKNEVTMSDLITKFMKDYLKGE